MRDIKPEKDKYATMDGPVMSKKESAPRYPTIRINLDHVPEAKKWTINKTYKVELGLKMVGISQSRWDNSAEFEIHQIGTESAKDAAEDESEGED